MNLIFLDVDGVLNSRNHLIEVYNQTHKPHSGYSYPFDENCLKNLQNLVLKTNSKLVIDSTWRKDVEGRKTLLKKLNSYNLDIHIIGYTPVLNSTRGVEIKSFLSRLKANPNFIILDDDSADMEDLLPHLIKTNPQTGLTSQNVEEGLIKLNRLTIKEEDKFER